MTQHDDDSGRSKIKSDAIDLW